MSELEDSVERAMEQGHDARLNSLVAILVAAAATFMALCNVKDGNVVQAMSQAQSHAIDAWTYYQAKGTKENIAEASAETLSVSRDTAHDLTPEARATYDRKIDEYKARAARFASEKQKIKADAEEFERRYERLYMRDDQFDAAVACLTVSIALFSVTALTRRRWLLGLGLVMLGFGALFGFSGFLGLGFHPDFLSRLLS